MSPAESAIFKLVEAALAPQLVFWARQNSGKRIKPYATMDILAVKMQTFPAQGEIDEDGNRIVVNDGQGTLVLEYLGAEAFGSAMRANGLLNSQKVNDLGFRLGVSIAHPISVVDLTTQVDQEWEERAVAEFHVLFTTSYTENVSRIERVVIGAPNVPSLPGPLVVGCGGMIENPSSGAN